MDKPTYNYDFKRNMISMLLAAIVAVAVTAIVGTALVNNKLQPTASAAQNHAPAVTTASTGLGSCTEPAGTTAGSNSGGNSAIKAVANIPLLSPGSNNTTHHNHYSHSHSHSGGSSTTTTTSTTRNSGNLVTVSDNNVLNNFLNSNTVLSGNETNVLNGNTTNVSVLSDLVDVTDNTVNTKVTDLIDANTSVKTVVGVLGL